MASDGSEARHNETGFIRRRHENGPAGHCRSGGTVTADPGGMPEAAGPRRSAGRYLAAGLTDGDRVVVIARLAHREALRTALAGAGCDVGGAEAAGRLLLLDAEATAAQFLVDGLVEPAGFDAAVGTAIRQAAAGRPLRVYGEMVALLWAAGTSPLRWTLSGGGMSCPTCRSGSSMPDRSCAAAGGWPASWTSHPPSNSSVDHPAGRVALGNTQVAASSASGWCCGRRPAGGPHPQRTSSRRGLSGEGRIRERTAWGDSGRWGACRPSCLRPAGERGARPVARSRRGR